MIFDLPSPHAIKITFLAFMIESTPIVMACLGTNCSPKKLLAASLRVTGSSQTRRVLE